jgi:hypothetical protein
MDSAVAPASPANASVDGRSVGWFLDGVERCSETARETAERDLSERDIVPADVDRWYPMTGYLAVVEAVAAATGPEALVAAGRCCGEALSGETGSVPEELEALDAAYRRHHRGAAGGYAFRQIGPNDGRIECATPYPCAFDRALVEGLARTAADGYVSIAEVSTCRDDGAERCTYELTW